MEELLPAFVPVAVYWVTCWVYEYSVITREKNRLFFDEEEKKNLATRKVGHPQIVSVIGRWAVKPKPASGYLQVAGQIATPMLIMDAWEYFWHRILHENQFLYKNFHAMHHRLLVPYSYGGQYTDMFDAFIGQNLSGAVAMAVSGMSPWTAAALFSLLSLKGVDDHCGMWFPGNPVHRFFRNNVAFHSVHHQIYGFKYNYSLHFLTTWDLLLGTYYPPVVEEKKGGGYILRNCKDD